MICCRNSRYPTPRRHLRRLFIDPITGKADWGLVTAPEGGIMGIYSQSDREPQKRANFATEDADFAAALQPQQTPDVAKSNGLQPFAPASSTAQLAPLEAAPYSYRDWKFVYRPRRWSGSAKTADRRS